MTARLRHHRAGIGDLHELTPFDDHDRHGDHDRHDDRVHDGASATAQVWWCDPLDDAVVLGSRQRPELLDPAAVSSAGLAVVRRRSGGGAVVVRRGTVCWIDLVLRHGTAPEDVRGSMVWAGERWRAALAPWLGGREVHVHRGGLITTPWSDLVCWAGVGPGEVLVGADKLVGLSQRRTRRWVRIQGMVHLADPGDVVAGLWAIDRPAGVPPRPAVAAAIDPAEVAARLVEQLS